MLVLPHPRPKGLRESQESGLLHQREGPSALASDPKSPLFPIWGPWLDQWGIGSASPQVGCDCFLRAKKGLGKDLTADTQLKDRG